MEGELIKSFLVSLGFDVDDASLKKFNEGIKSATLRVAGLFAGVQIMTAGVVAGVLKVSEGFEDLGYQFRLIPPMINKVVLLRNATLEAYKAAGVNLRQAALNAQKLNLSVEHTKIAFEAIYKSVAVKFFPLITQQSEKLRATILKNMPKILAISQRVVKFLFSAFEISLQFAQRVWSIFSRIAGALIDLFKGLDEATNGWSTKILALVAAFKILNLSFLFSPLGAFLALLAAGILLWDDFKTAQEGGNSLFNWKELADVVKGVMGVFDSLKNTISAVFDIFGNLGVAIYALFQGDFRGFVDNLVDSFDALLNVIKGIASTVLNLGSILGSVGGHIADLFGGKSHIINTQNIGASPLGSQNNSTRNNNVNVNAQTNVNVSGAADANAVGKSVAGQQKAVNFHLTNNIKSATQ